jgi:hypothetical protein
MNTLALAAETVLHPPETRTLEYEYARELLDTQARLERALNDVRRLSHQPELIQPKPVQKIWPVYVKCDYCAAVVAFDPAPEEAVMVKALHALGWTTANGHTCWECE